MFALVLLWPTNCIPNLAATGALNGATLLASFDYDDFEAAAWPSERKLAPSGQRRGLQESIKYLGSDYRRRVAWDNDNLNRLRANRIRSATGANWPGWAPAALPGTAASGDILYDVTPGYGDSAGYDKAGNRRSRNSSGVTLITSSGSSALAAQSGLAYDLNDRLTRGALSTMAGAKSNFLSIQ
jgi:hypothetical protein